MAIKQRMLDYTGLAYFYAKIKARLGLKVDKVDGKALSTNDYTTAEKDKLAGIAAGANNYAHPTQAAIAAGLRKVGGNTSGHVVDGGAVTKTDITALGIPAQDTVYTHPTAAGYNHIPAGGASGQVLKWSADGTAAWAAMPSFFVQSGTPSGAVSGSIWFDTTSGSECVKYYTGSAWTTFGAVYK